HHAVALTGEVAVPGCDGAGGAAAEPAVPACTVRMARSQPRGGAEPTAVPHHAQLAGAEAGPVQYQPQRPRREMGQVPRQVQSVPSLTEPTKRQAVDVRHGDDQLALWGQKAVGFAQYFERVVDVLERLPHGDDV